MFAETINQFLRWGDCGSIPWAKDSFRKVVCSEWMRHWTSPAHEQVLNAGQLVWFKKDLETGLCPQCTELKAKHLLICETMNLMGFRMKTKMKFDRRHGHQNLLDWSSSCTGGSLHSVCFASAQKWLFWHVPDWNTICSGSNSRTTTNDIHGLNSGLRQTAHASSILATLFSAKIKQSFWQWNCMSNHQIEKCLAEWKKGSHAVSPARHHDDCVLSPKSEGNLCAAKMLQLWPAMILPWFWLSLLTKNACKA